jgi:hypothetical protein
LITVLSWAEKEKMVIELYKQGVSPKEIARQLHMSLRDVYSIIRKEFGEKKRELTNELKALILYRQGKMPVEVAIKLRITSDEAIQFYIKYKDLIHLGKFGKAYHLVKGQGQLKELLDICEAMKIDNLTVKDMVNAYQLSHDLAEMEDRFLTVANDTVVYEGRKNTTLSELDQAETKLTKINSFIQVGNAELTRIKNSIQAYSNQNQINTNMNYGYSNNNPYYYTGYNYGNY